MNVKNIVSMLCILMITLALIIYDFATRVYTKRFACLHDIQNV